MYAFIIIEHSANTQALIPNGISSFVFPHLFSEVYRTHLLNWIVSCSLCLSKPAYRLT